MRRVSFYLENVFWHRWLWPQVTTKRFDWDGHRWFVANIQVGPFWFVFEARS